MLDDAQETRTRDFRMPQINNCPCCSLDRLVIALRTQDRQGNLVTIFHCTNCCALAPYYKEQPDDIVSHQADFHADYWSDSTRNEVITGSKAMNHTVEFYRKYLDYFGSESEILDLGGGRGLLTKALLNNGYRARGCDASAELVRIGRYYLDIPRQLYTKEDITNFVKRHKSTLNQQVGVIFLWHVIEHLENPLTILKSLRGLLRPDGIVIAQGPLLDKSYIFPEHRFLHSESNIGWLAKALDMKLLFLDSCSEERFVSFVLSNQEHPGNELNILGASDVHDAIGSLFSTLSNALHFTKSN